MPLHRATLKGTNLRGQPPICSFLRAHAIFCASQMLFSRKRRESAAAKISVCPFRFVPLSTPWFQEDIHMSEKVTQDAGYWSSNKYQNIAGYGDTKPRERRDMCTRLVPAALAETYLGDRVGLGGGGLLCNPHSPKCPSRSGGVIPEGACKSPATRGFDIGAHTHTPVASWKIT